ncbi:MAG: hypothetical protein M3285_06535 [Actinomycetota bacterium]|nr:hypothetical protein [Actinomycetota bacterium]
MEALARRAGSDPLTDIRLRLEPEAMRARALDELNELFRGGSPPDPAPRGFQPGTLVTLSVAKPIDAFARRLSKLYMPWMGKSFDADKNEGINILRSKARSQVKVLWPSYEPHEADGKLEAFPFKTRVAPGALDPDVQVLKIDYDFEANPDFLIRRILDELVQIEDGFYLGKILYRARGNWHPIGFFSLQNP